MQKMQELEPGGGLESLLPYCTPAQERVIRAIIDAGSVRKGAKALSVKAALAGGGSAGRMQTAICNHEAERGFKLPHGTGCC